MDLFDLLKGQLGDVAIGALTNQLGGAQPAQTAKGLDGAMSILMGALANNAKSNDGISSLSKALDNDHDGSILDDVVGFINGSAQPKNPRAANGAGILGHLLGTKQGPAVEELSKMSGLDQSQASSMLIKLAPIVLGMLGKEKRSNGLDGSALTNILAQSASTAVKKTSGAENLLKSFIDQDGDGDIMDDAMRIGGNLLKGLFK